MQTASSLVKVHLANYLRDLPLPDSILGWFSLGIRDWLKLAPFFGAAGGIGYLVYRQVKPKQLVNFTIKKSDPKIVDFCDIEDMTDEKLWYCRCWKSKNFPFCDGSHNEHNTLTGDNVGPLCVRKKKQ